MQVRSQCCLWSKNRFKKYNEAVGNATNGLSDFLVTFGIAGCLLILWLGYYNFFIYYNHKGFAFLALFIILILSFSEQIFNKAILWCLFMFYLNIHIKKKIIN